MSVGMYGIRSYFPLTFCLAYASPILSTDLTPNFLRNPQWVGDLLKSTWDCYPIKRATIRTCPINIHLMCNVSLSVSFFQLSIRGYRWDLQSRQLECCRKEAKSKVPISASNKMLTDTFWNYNITRYRITASRQQTSSASQTSTLIYLFLTIVSFFVDDKGYGTKEEATMVLWQGKMAS